MQAAEQNYAKAQYVLGICYENGYGVEKNREEAREWYTKAAEQGNIYAQGNLGWLLYEQEEYGEAFKWFSESGHEGYASSQYGMGECYYYGRGVGQNYEQAKLWYEKAAEQEHMGSLLQLGHIYYFGKCGEPDYVTAVTYYEKAAELGSAEGQHLLAFCYETGQGVECTGALRRNVLLWTRYGKRFKRSSKMV